jgi:GalNAc-alpha-(1->4)-GalNAc-alpha-(1->3)-diNAcBac-PP-undecaprenol alpha-1,4-N-acetyl-D-galactosaminyltransferase
VMRILCIIPQMGSGGAERVMACLVNWLSSRHMVSVLTWELPGTHPFFPLATSVEVVQAGLFGGRGLNRLIRVASRFLLIRRKVRSWRPDLVLSFLDTTNITTVLSCLGTGIPVVISERVDPAGHVVDLAVRLARGLTYPLAAQIVVQTCRVAQYFPARMHARISILPNPITAPQRLAVPDVPGPDGRYRVVGVGRLERQKGFDRLIAAFAQVAARHPLWDLHIFGEGSQLAALSEQIYSYGLNKRVRLAGLTKAVHEELAAGHIFALSSHYEGFPNALGEAIRAGLPTVGFNYVSGVEEMIVPGITGYLASTEGGTIQFGDYLEQLMTNEDQRRKFGIAAAEFGSQWEEEVILKRWEALLSQMITFYDRGAKCY